MKVNINYTINIDNRYRRAVRAWYGDKGLATRKELKNWFIIYGESMDTTVIEELERQEKEGE